MDHFCFCRDLERDEFISPWASNPMGNNFDSPSFGGGNNGFNGSFGGNNQFGGSGGNSSSLGGLGFSNTNSLMSNNGKFCALLKKKMLGWRAHVGAQYTRNNRSVEIELARANRHQTHTFPFTLRCTKREY